MTISPANLAAASTPEATDAAEEQDSQWAAEAQDSKLGEVYVQKDVDLDPDLAIIWQFLQDAQGRGPKRIDRQNSVRHIILRIYQALAEEAPAAKEVAADRAILRRQSWNPHTRLLAMDEIHKMPGVQTWGQGRSQL